MANICTNIFYLSTENKKNIEKVTTFLGDNFYCNYLDDYLCKDSDVPSWVDAEFESKWSYPEERIEELVSSLEPDPTLYIRILSHELCSEYASFRVYKDGEWKIDF